MLVKEQVWEGVRQAVCEDVADAFDRLGPKCIFLLGRVLDIAMMMTTGGAVECGLKERGEQKESFFLNIAVPITDTWISS